MRENPSGNRENEGKSQLTFDPAKTRPKPGQNPKFDPDDEGTVGLPMNFSLMLMLPAGFDATVQMCYQLFH